MKTAITLRSPARLPRDRADNPGKRFTVLRADIEKTAAARPLRAGECSPRDQRDAPMRIFITPASITAADGFTAVVSPSPRAAATWPPA